MSNETSSPRKVVPYRPGKRISTVRKLDLDFGGTALEQALLQAALQEKEVEQKDETEESQYPTDTSIQQIPVPNRHQYPTDTSIQQNEFSGEISTKDETRGALGAQQTGAESIDYKENTILTSTPVVPSEQDQPSEEAQEHWYLSDTSISPIPVSQIPVSDRYQYPDNDDSAPENPSVKTKNKPAAKPFVDPKSHFVKVPHSITDRIFTLLDPYEFKVYFRLFRLSHGFQQSTCFIGFKALSESTSISIPQLKRVIPKLVQKGVIRVSQVFNTNDKKGTEYEVHTDLPDTSINQIPVSIGYQYQSDTGIQQIPNKRKRHDHDLKENHHHQSARTRVMMTFESLTGKKWSKADERALEQIDHIDESLVVDLMHTIQNRSSEPIKSFAYFAKSILDELAGPPAAGQGRNQIRTKLEKILAEIRNTHTGDQNFRISDLAYEAKKRCLREGIAWNDDVFNEIIEKKMKS